MTFADKLLNYVRAAYPCVTVLTAEEMRVAPEILGVAKRYNEMVGEKRTIGCYTWSAVAGLQQVYPRTQDFPDTTDLLPACASISELEDAVIIMRDVHTWPLDRDPQMLRAMREAIQGGPGQGRTMVITAPSFVPHPTIERLVTILDYALPDEEALRVVAAQVAEGAETIEGAETVVSEDLIRAMGGLTSEEAANALSLSLVERKTFDPEVVHREKIAAVRRGGLLEYVEPDPRGLDAIGGFAELKSWILKRRRAYGKEATKFGLPRPRGCLLLGVPGTGKSLAAKCVGTALGIPTLRLDIGTLFNSLVGESEARTRQALAMAEAMAPCVLFCDEIDKALGGAGSSNDSGVSMRVLGTILIWMQECTAQVFVVASANRVDALPPELLRKGRWDELWAVDLPDVADRVEILRIHVAKRGRDPEVLCLPEAAVAAIDFTGSELEAVVNEALFDAFDEQRDLEPGDLLAAVKRTVPLAVTAKEQIGYMREWAKGRARYVAKPRETIDVETDVGPTAEVVAVAVKITDPAAPADAGNQN